MKKLCICIPTYNRASCIDFVLKQSIHGALSNDVDIYICDTSENADTESVVKKYEADYLDHLRYERIHDYPDKTTDLKVVECFKKLQSEYMYIYLCGDGLVVDIDELMRRATTYFDHEYDVIHFNFKIKELRDYHDCTDFACDCAWYVTYYGSTIISSKLIETADYDYYLGKYRNTGFLVWEMIFSQCAARPAKIVSIDTLPYSDNPFKPVNSSFSPGRFMNFWIDNWIKVVDDLPEEYDTVKTYIKKDLGIKIKLYTFGKLILLRLSKNLDPTEIKSREEKIKQVTDQPLWLIKAVSRIPIPVLKLIEPVLLFMRKLLRILRKEKA